MSSHTWKYHAGRLLTAFVLIALVGVLSGYPLHVIGSAALIYACWHLANLWRLYRWLHEPADAIPEGFGIWRDIYDRFNSLQKSKQRQRQRYVEMIGEFRSLTDAFPDATLVIDQNDTLTWFNSGAVNMLGLRHPEDLGHAVTNLLRDPDFANWLAVQPGVKSPLEMRSPRDDTTWLTVSAVSFRENQRLIILRDSTRMHNLEQVRQDLIANMSHELRTPLTVLQGYLELLADHQSREVCDTVERMLSQTGQMRTMLDDLLELSRLQTEENRSEEEVVNIPAMLGQLKEQAEELSRGNHHLKFRIESESCLSGVAADLESAFSNLVGNAIKYTPGNGKITVGWKEGTSGPEFSVRDNGIGIPRRDIPRLTERFYRVGSDRTRDTGGSGLGLAIVKHVLNAHQAELSIESELGKGSKFTCSFPRSRQCKGTP